MAEKRTLMSEEEISEALSPFWIAGTECPSCRHARPGFYALSPSERDREVAKAQDVISFQDGWDSRNALATRQSKAHEDICFSAGRKKEAEDLQRVIDFAYKVARTMNELKSSHVFFILQQAFGGDMEWADVQEALTVVLEKSEAKLKELEGK